jgi:uncharacterized protein (DUF2267 family)
MAHAGGSADSAERAAVAVLTAIGGHLSPGHRGLVADELSPALAAALATPRDVAAPIEEHVLVPGMTVGRARELVASVCRVLVEELSTEAVQIIRNTVPSLATYFVRPSPAAARARGRVDSLAAGRPGSQHPISEAANQAQTESVVAENPHGATKLSSSEGATQERDHTTLAEGAPDRGRSIARSRT